MKRWKSSTLPTYDSASIPKLVFRSPNHDTFPLLTSQSQPAAFPDSIARCNRPFATLKCAANSRFARYFPRNAVLARHTSAAIAIITRNVRISAGPLLRDNSHTTGIAMTTATSIAHAAGFTRNRALMPPPVPASNARQRQAQNFLRLVASRNHQVQPRYRVVQRRNSHRAEHREPAQRFAAGLEEERCGSAHACRTWEVEPA